MRVLVTGGAGFIGSHVVDVLRQNGQEPSALDDLSGGKRENLPDDVPLFEADIRNRESLRPAFDASQPEVVVHLAAQVSVSRSVREPDVDADTNIMGLLNVLGESARVGVRQVVFASSGGALYGDVTGAEEDHPCLPISPYGISKLTGERYLEFFTQERDLKAIALRFTNVYGPRQDPHGEAGVVAIFCQKMLAGEGVRINGDGKYVRDYVEVGDVARAVATAADAALPASFAAFNIGTGVGTDVNQLADAVLPICAEIRAARGIATAIDPPQHGPARAGDLRSNSVSPARIGRELNWQPQTALADGLRRTAQWFADREA